MKRFGIPTALRSVTAAALLALAAASVCADPLDDALARSPYAARDREQIAALVRAAEGRGIPLELSLPRLEEGIAKRVPAAKVREVLSREIERIESARSLLAAADPGGEIARLPEAWQRGATLLAWGAAPHEVSSLARASSGLIERFAQAASLLVSLVQWGLPRDAAVEVAAAAAASGIPAGDLAGITAMFTAGRRQRRDPVELARALVRELPGAKSLRQLREKTLYE
jgi:hypothetical protein